MRNLEFVEQIGAGQYGEVWLAKDLGLNILRAVKLLPRTSLGDVGAFNEEARILRANQHPNIVQVYATDFGPDEGQTPDVGMYAIVMEHMSGGSLERSLRETHSSVLHSIQVTSDICRGLERVHSLNYLHRDVKPANILMDGRNAKLSDFGLSILASSGNGSGAGTFEYLAPETINNGVTSAATDIYSLGVTCFQTLNGWPSLNFSGSDDDLQRAISRGQFPDRTDYRSSVPPALRKVVNKAINIDAAKRFSAASDFRHALEGVKILCDWRMIQSGEPEEWVGTALNGIFRIQMSPSGLVFELSKCMSVPGSFRKVTADCARFSNAREMRHHRDAVMLRLATTGR